jgi:hypothetical protein
VPRSSPAAWTRQKAPSPAWRRVDGGPRPVQRWRARPASGGRLQGPPQDAGSDATFAAAYGIVTDLTAAGYVVKHKDGRRSRYQIQAHPPLPQADSRKRTTGEMLALLAGADDEPTA